MDKDQALLDVQEIKQTMEASRKHFDRRKYWIVPLVALLAIIVCGLFPILSPFIAAGMLAGGIILWRRSRDPVMKAFAVGIIAGGIIILMVILFAVLGLVAYGVFGGAGGPAAQTVIPAP